MHLGIDLLKTAGSMLPALFGPDGTGAPGVMPLPDTGTGAPGTDTGVTTQVSPAIQTQISPQISPTMTQIQSSPGAGVMAAPQQLAPGGQTAVTPMGAPGESMPSSILPAQPQYGYSPQPYGALPSPIPAGAMPTAFRTGLDKMNWTPIAVAGILAVAAVSIFGRRRKRTS